MPATTLRCNLRGFGVRVPIAGFMNYHAACYEVQPGDMLACKSRGIVADLIAQVSPLHSHVAMIVSARPAVVAESTARSNLPDVESGLLTTGVQAHFLTDWLAAYDGQVWLYQLKNMLTEQQSEILAAWIETQHRNKVGYDLSGVMRLGIKRLGLNNFAWLDQPDAGSLFCSEMVTAAYQAAELITALTVARDVTPDDCCLWDLFREPITLK